LTERQNIKAADIGKLARLLTSWRVFHRKLTHAYVPGFTASGRTIEMARAYVDPHVIRTLPTSAIWHRRWSMAKRVFTPEFKRDSVRIASKLGLSNAQAARDLGLHPNVLNGWRKKFKSGKWKEADGVDLKSVQTREIERLQCENTELRFAGACVRCLGVANR
jgi:transposase